jgi:hypothetical protein
MVDLIRRPRPSESILRSFIQESLRLGRSANESLRRLHDLGYGMRRSEFLRWFRDIANLERSKDAFLSTALDKVFSSKHYSVNENRVAGFRSIFRVQLMRSDSVSAERIITISHNKPLRKRELLERIKEVASNFYISTDNEVSYNEFDIKPEYRVTSFRVIAFEGGSKGWTED